MHRLDRRHFLGTSLTGLAALAAGPSVIAKDKSSKSKSIGKSNTLFLTWQRDPTTTMTVQWLGAGESADDTAVHFQGVGSSDAARSVATRSRPYPMSNLQVFRAELTGLKPGSEYQFTIGRDATPHRFRTMPARLTDSFKFISGGDCDTNDYTRANNALAAKQDPMFTLIGGDLGYDDGKKVDTSIDFIRNYSQAMVDTQGRLIPMVVTIGNHEVDGGYGKPRTAAPFYFALHDGLFADRSYATLDFGDYLSLVLLDTGHVAPIEGEQTAWLDKSLARRADCPHVFVANHVPSYPSYRKVEASGGKAGTGELSRQHWVPLFERHNVNAVFEHHDHTFKRTHPLKDGMINNNGVIYLGDGSWGKLRVPQKPEDRPYLAVTSGVYHISLHRIEGNDCHHVAMSDTGEVIDSVVTTRKRPTRTPSRSG